MTRTYAVLELSAAAWDEIATKLRAAGYDHAFMEGGEIDMHGIAVKAADGPVEDDEDDDRGECQANRSDWVTPCPRCRRNIGEGCPNAPAGYV